MGKQALSLNRSSHVLAQLLDDWVTPRSPLTLERPRALGWSALGL